MRIHSAIAAAALVLTSGTAMARPSPEAQLAAEIEGRVAGEPVNCIDLQRVRNTRIIENTAIVYDAGATIYVNKPRGGAKMLDEWDVMVVKPFGSQLCTPESVQLLDRNTGMVSGFVNLGEFVPYKKVKTASND